MMKFWYHLQEEVRTNILALLKTGQRIDEGDIVEVCQRATPDNLQDILSVAQSKLALVYLDPSFPYRAKIEPIEIIQTNITLSLEAYVLENLAEWSSMASDSFPKLAIKEI